MNKLFTKIASLSVGLALAVGVGVAVGSKGSAKVVKAADLTAEKTTNTLQTEYGWTVSAGTTIGDIVTEFALDSHVTISTSGSANCGTVWGTTTKDWRLYQNKSGDITVTAATGYELKSITLTYGNKNGGVLKDGTTTVSSGSEQSASGSSKTYTVGNSGTATNGNVQITKFKVVYVESQDPSLSTMRIQDDHHTVGPFEVTYGDTSEYKYALAWDVDNNHAINSDCTWEVSDESVIDYYVDGYTWLNYKPKSVGITTITVSHEGYAPVSTTITVVPGTVASVAVSGSMSTTSYLVGQDWSADGLVVTATYDSGWEETPTTGISWSFNPVSPALGVDSVVATATYGGQSGSSAAQTVSVSKTNQIQVIYTKSSGSSVDVYGYYVGFLEGTGPVIMDGEYGVVVYNKSADVSEYTEKETILHVTGNVSIYNGLYEIGSASMSVATSVPEASVPATPVVYAAKGGETADCASRLTTVTGTAVVTSGSFDSDAGTADIKMNFTVGSQTVQVFYKKAAQTADAEAFAAMKAAVVGGTEITIKGFTSWYNGFQVQMKGYVPAAENYTAEDFAQDLLDQTDAVCASYKEGDNNHDALEAIWSDLASDDKYPSLPSDQKTILANAERDEHGTTVEQAMARYDFLTGKYNLSNFINGRTPVQLRPAIEFEAQNNTTMIIIVAIATVSAVSLATLLIIKKRKHN